MLVDRIRNDLNFWIDWLFLYLKKIKNGVKNEMKVKEYKY